MGMVELSLVEDLGDIKELKELIINHHSFTGSTRAQDILENWESSLNKFIKIIPYEYMKVLEEEKLEVLRKKIELVETDPEIKSGEMLI
jgi:glutamate synthase (NADPH/NADH) large chain